MSLSIEGVYVDRQAVPDIYMFEFSDGEYVGLQKNTADRHSKFDGALYSAWFTTAGTIVNDPEEISAGNVPSKIADRDVYWIGSNSDAGREEERVDLIKNRLR